VNTLALTATTTSICGPAQPIRSPQKLPKTVILSSARTPIGKLGGGLASLDATALGGTAIRCALERAEVAPEEVSTWSWGR